MIPLNAGIVGSIGGLDEVKKLPCVADFIQYYNIGETVEQRFIGTLGQHFGRFTAVADEETEIYDAVEKINNTLKIFDTDGMEMNVFKFDRKRMEHKEII